MLSIAVALMVQTDTRAEALNTLNRAAWCLAREAHAENPDAVDEGFDRALQDIEVVMERCASEIATAARADQSRNGRSSSEFVNVVKGAAVEAYHRTYLAPARR
jgi:hypothetical protein